MSLDGDRWVPVKRRGYRLQLPATMKPFDMDTGGQELAEFGDDASGLLVGTYRWVQPLTGSLGLEATLGHVVAARDGRSERVLSDTEALRTVSFTHEAAGSSTTTLAALRLLDGDVAVVAVTYPTAAGAEVGETVDSVILSLAVD